MATSLEEILTKSLDENKDDTLLRMLTAFIHIELCGSFLTGKTGPGTTTKNFYAFSRSKYMPEEYHKIAPLLLSIFRNGIAHCYLPKGGAIPTSERVAADKHLHFYEQGICIYVPKLAEDVKTAIKNIFNDIRENTISQKSYYSIFEQSDQIGKSEYEKFLEENGIQTEKDIWLGDINISLEK